MISARASGRQRYAHSPDQWDVHHIDELELPPLRSKPPRRTLVPLAHGIVSPRGCLIRVARGARIGGFIFVRHGGRYEAERVRVNHRIRRTFRFDRWHVASDTLASRATIFVVCVFLDSRCPWPVRR